MCTVQVYNLDSKSYNHWLTKVNAVTLRITAHPCVEWHRRFKPILILTTGTIIKSECCDNLG